MTVPTLRRLPVPVSEPPFDDEYADRPAPCTAVPAVQGTLALAFVLPSGVPAQPTAPPELRLLPSPARPEAEETADEVEFGPQPTASSDLPEVRGWAGRFAQALVEVLAGDRPMAQLVRWTNATVYDELTARLSLSPSSATYPATLRARAARGRSSSAATATPGPAKRPPDLSRSPFLHDH